MSERHCKGCGAALPPEPVRRGRKRVWCSDYCRKQTLYATADCISCGTRLPYYGHPEPPEGRRCIDCEQTRNAECNARIVRAWNEGEPEWYIAEREGLSGGQVRGVIKSARERGERVELHRKRNRSDWPEIERLWNAGWTGGEIAEAIGDSASGVAQKIENMRKAGIDLPRRICRGGAYSEEDVAELEVMWARGDTPDEIGAAFGITRRSATSLISRLRAEGYDFPKRKPGPAVHA